MARDRFPDSMPICGLSLLVLYSVPRGLIFPGYTSFPLLVNPQKPTFDLICSDFVSVDLYSLLKVPIMLIFCPFFNFLFKYLKMGTSRNFPHGVSMSFSRRLIYTQKILAEPVGPGNLHV